MISVRGYTCRPVEKRADSNRPPATQFPVSRPPAPRPAPMVKSPNPVRDSALTRDPGDLQALSEALDSFHDCLVVGSGPWERLTEATKMMDVLRKRSALRLPDLAKLWEHARAVHYSAMLEIAGPDYEQVAAISAPAFLSPFVSPASSLPAVPAFQPPASPSQVPALHPPAPPVPAFQPPASASPASPAPALQSSASPAPALQATALQPPALQPLAPSAPGPSAPARASAVPGPSSRTPFSHPVLGMSDIHSLRGGAMGHVLNLNPLSLLLTPVRVCIWVLLLRLLDTMTLLDIATSLDRRFKMDYISEDNKTTVKARLTHEMTDITSVMVIMFTSDHTHNDIHTF